MGVRRIVSSGGNSGYFQVVAKSSFQGEAKRGEISFCQLETTRNIVFLLQCEYKKFQNPGGLGLPFTRFPTPMMLYILLVVQKISH